MRFQRATVLATEFVVLGGAVRAATAGTARDAAPFALSAALIAVDHVHFQYNGLVRSPRGRFSDVRRGDAAAADIPSRRRRGRDVYIL